MKVDSLATATPSLEKCEPSRMYHDSARKSFENASTHHSDDLYREEMADIKMMTSDDDCTLEGALNSLLSISHKERLEALAGGHESKSQSIIEERKISIDIAYYLLQMEDVVEEYDSEEGEDYDDLYSCSQDSITITIERRKRKARSLNEASYPCNSSNEWNEWAALKCTGYNRTRGGTQLLSPSPFKRKLLLHSSPTTCTGRYDFPRSALSRALAGAYLY